eukprot:7726357-Heterocapsa_arctica.AAC.1
MAPRSSDQVRGQHGGRSTCQPGSGRVAVLRHATARLTRTQMLEVHWQPLPTRAATNRDLRPTARSSAVHRPSHSKPRTRSPSSPSLHGL